MAALGTGAAKAGNAARLATASAGADTAARKESINMEDLS
jgi:hypothetical protein